MENLAYFVSSRGLLKSCDHHNKHPISSSIEIDFDILKNLKSNESIYICTDALINFSKNYLEKITNPFVLVSGDSDIEINERFLEQTEIQAILSSNYMTLWYAQNLNITHEKITALPIGLDYHTMRNTSGIWGLVKQSPLAQERSLINNLAISKKISDRFFSVYCNWHFAIDRGNRLECLNQIEKSICFFEQNPLPRISSWQRQSDFMFVLSPEGKGIDCHRTWEALALGCIPVIKRNCHSKIFNGLPVLLIDEWSDLTQNILLDTLNKFISSKFNYENLFLNYWINCIRNKRQKIFSYEQTMQEFRDEIHLESH